jgi:hypothetical protein
MRVTAPMTRSAMKSVNGPGRPASAASSAEVGLALIGEDHQGH